MIKNILYSAILHLALLFLLIFTVRKTEFKTSFEPKGVKVSVISFSDKNTFNGTEVKEKIEEKPEKEIKKKEEKKPELKKKELPKKEKKKPKIEEKKKEEPKKEEVKKDLQKKEKPEPKKLEKPEKPKNQPPKDDLLKTQKIPDQIAGSEDGAPDIQDLDLSEREKLNIKTQLNVCFLRVFQNQIDDTKIDLELHLELDREGKLIFDEGKNIDQKRYNDPNEFAYKNLMDQVMQSVELCGNLRNLEDSKFEIWQKFRVKLRKKDD